MNLKQYIASHNKSHIIFDFDATLFLLVLPWTKWKITFQKELGSLHGHIWDSYQKHEITLAEAQNQYIQAGGEVARTNLNTFNANFEKAYLVEVKHNRQLLEALHELPENLTLYVWSSNSLDTIQSVLDRNDMAGKFAKIVTRKDVPLIKPDPSGFHLIHDENIHKSQYLMVGDSNADRDAAKAAEIDFYLIDYFENA